MVQLSFAHCESQGFPNLVLRPSLEATSKGTLSLYIEIIISENFFNICPLLGLTKLDL